MSGKRNETLHCLYTTIYKAQWQKSQKYIIVPSNYNDGIFFIKLSIITY